MNADRLLVLEGSLECELDGTPWTLSAENQQIVVDIPDLATGLKLLRLGSPRGAGRRRLHEAKRLLDLTSHQLICRVDGRRVLRVGHLVGRRWWRLAGLPALSFDLSNLFALAVGRRDAS